MHGTQNTGMIQTLLLIDTPVVNFSPDVLVCARTRGTTTVPACRVDVNEVTLKKTFAKTFISPLCVSIKFAGVSVKE